MENVIEDVVERFHPRIEADLTVQVLDNGRVIPARARDLSMAGLFLQGHPVRRQRFTLCIPLPGDRVVTTHCEVRRWTEEGMALEFDQLDWDDLLALARFLHPRLP